MAAMRETGTAEGVQITMPRKGEPDVLTVRRQAPVPAPKVGKVVVRVEAAGVSFAEVQMLKGRYFSQPKFPFVPGYDLVGIVEQVGEGVDSELLGRRVAALTETGAWADCAAVDAKLLAPVPEGVDPADAKLLAPVPEGVDPADAVAVVIRNPAEDYWIVILSEARCSGRISPSR